MIVSSSISSPADGSRPGGLAGYRQVRAVEARAAATRYDQDADTRQALSRLGRMLGSGEAFRTDVPPGFYVNIVV